MGKKKIAVLLHGLGANGIDTLFANLSEVWNYQQFEITYFIAVDSDHVQFWEPRVSNTQTRVVKLHDLDKGRLKIWPFTLYKSLKRYGPFDVVYTNMDMLNGINLIVAFVAGVKTRIAHAHRGSSNMPNNVLKRVFKTIYISLMKGLMRLFSTSRIGCSDVAGEYFFGKGNYELIYNGIDVNHYMRTVASGSGSHRFIAVGRLHAQKNPIKIVEIFKAVHDYLPNATLTWLGEGAMRLQVEAKIKELGLQDSIRLMGVRSDVANFLKEADYYLLPSLFEGLSLALAEAQAAGLVCFISDTCSRLSDCGLCKYISLDLSSEEWARIIVEYISGGETQLKLNLSALQKFSIENTACQIEKLF